MKTARSHTAAWWVVLAATVAIPRLCFAGRQSVDNVAPTPPLAPAVVARDGDGRATFRAVPLSEPLRIDGRLEERVYATVPAIDGFVQMEPDYGAAATEPTEVWIFYDSDTLYVSARCWDSAPQERWVANEMRRDNRTITRQNEALHVALDTFYDRRNAFLFTITPIGGIFDGQITNERVPANADWNPVWERSVGRFEGGWSVEMAIPFKSLRYKAGGTQIWGVNLLRLVRWKNEQTFVVPLPRSASNGIFLVSRYATLVGLEVPAGSRNLEIKPYALSSATRDPVNRPASPDDIDGKLGLDVKYGLTQNLTADFTVNTDFAQVEADEQQVNLTRFNLLFPEKREFFLENAGLFEFGGTASGDMPILFYSRQIGLHQGQPVPVLAGGRLTGKAGRTSLGVLNVQTDDAPDIGARGTNFSVIRVRRDVLRRSTVGAMFTRRSSSALRDGANTVYGVDAALGFFNTVTINSYLARTQSAGVSGDDLSYRTQFVYDGDRYGLQLERLDVEGNFNPEVGFLRRSDFRQTVGQARFSPRPRRSALVRRYIAEATYRYVTDGDGRLDTRSGAAGAGIDFQSGDMLDSSVERTQEWLRQPFRIARGVTIPVGRYEYQQLATTYLFGIQRRVSGSLSFGHGSFYGGRRTTVAYRAARVELTPRVSLEPSVSINRVALPQGRFTTRLVSTRATFTMTPRVFVTGLMQFNSSNRTVSSNVRLRWEYRAGSELFLIYTDERDTGAAGFARVDNRAVAVKINRLLRF